MDQTNGISLKTASLSLDQAASDTIQGNRIEAKIEQIDFDFESGIAQIATTKADINTEFKDSSAIQLNVSSQKIWFNAKSSQLSANTVELDGEIYGRELNMLAPSISANIDSQSAKIGSAKLLVATFLLFLLSCE